MADTDPASEGSTHAPTGWTYLAMAASLPAAAACVLAVIGYSPPPGVFIGIMGCIAACLTFRKDPDRSERAAWVMVLTILMVSEIWSLYAYDRKQTATLKTITGNLQDTSTKLSAEAGDLKKVLSTSDHIKQRVDADDLLISNLDAAHRQQTKEVELKRSAIQLSGSLLNLIDDWDRRSAAIRAVEYSDEPHTPYFAVEAQNKLNNQKVSSAKTYQKQVLQLLGQIKTLGEDVSRIDPRLTPQAETFCIKLDDHSTIYECASALEQIGRAMP